MDSSDVVQGGAEHGTITYVPGVNGPSGSARFDAVGLAAVDWLGDGGRVDDEPGDAIPPDFGQKVIAITPTAMTAAAPAANSLNEAFMRLSLRAGHQARRCGVSGRWSSTA